MSIKTLDWSSLVSEIPEKEQLAKLEERRTQWKEGQTKDGYIVTWEKQFTHHGVVFCIKILRYYVLDKTGFQPMSYRLSDKHAVVEYPEATKPLANLVGELDISSEFLWSDTLHSCYDHTSLEEQLQGIYEAVLRDIERLPSMIKEKHQKLDQLSAMLEAAEMSSSRINTPRREKT